MASQGPNYPGVATSQPVSPESDEAWKSTSSVGADDGVYTYITGPNYDAPDISYRLTAYALGFSIPTEATIDGIKVEIERKCDPGETGKDYRVQLQDWYWALVGDNKADTVNDWPTTDTIKEYGGPTDDWNASLTPGIINDEAFGVVLSVQATADNADIYVDFIRVTIYYFEEGGTRAQVTWAEAEAPLAPRRAGLTWAELEVPPGVRRAIATWGEAEFPEVVSRRARITWGELELPLGPRMGQTTWSELEVPEPLRSVLLTWVELETPDAPRRAQITWAEVEAPEATRASLITWAEAEVPEYGDRIAFVSWAEVEIPDVPSDGWIRRVVQAGAIIKVCEMPDRRLRGGAATPVVIVTDVDRSIIAGRAIPVRRVDVGSRPLRGGAALRIVLCDPKKEKVFAEPATPIIVVSEE